MSSETIWIRTESLIVLADGEKLKTPLGEVGDGLLQFIAQQNRAAPSEETFIPFFLQQSIADIPSWLPPNTEAPARTLPVKIRRRINAVSHLAII